MRSPLGLVFLTARDSALIRGEREIPDRRIGSVGR
jgi:hypothetical protein